MASRKPSISSVVGLGPSDNLATVAGTTPERKQIFAFADALAWHLWRFPGDATQVLRFRIPTGEHEAAVREAICTLAATVTMFPIELQDASGRAVSLIPTDFAGRCGEWAKRLRRQEREMLPELAQSLQDKIGHPGFAWYRTVYGTAWSGRAEGLEVCRLEPTSMIRIGVGNGPERDDERAPALFRQICKRHTTVAIGQGFPLATANLDAIAALLLEVCDDRASGSLAGVEREHHLESRVRRGVVPVTVGQYPLVPVISASEAQFQFPTQWSTKDGGHNYVDVVMRQDAIPWVVELKVPPRPPGRPCMGEKYRHAIAQAALYRHFVRSASELHFWFQDRQLQPDACRAAVAFPITPGDDPTALEAVAKCLDVTVIGLDKA